MIVRICVLEIIFLVLSSMAIATHAANINGHNNKNKNKKKNRNKNNKRPNVIVIMTDEHNFRTISSYRNHLLSKYPKKSVDVWGDNVFVETPNIDSLANDGVMFTNFYSPLPQCTPSRASFMTGMYPDATGASTNHQPMNEDQTTWAQILQQNGYYTGYVGKFHLDGETIPGFDAPEGRNFGFNHTKYRYNRGHWKCFDELDNGEIKVYSDFKQCKKDFSKQDLKKHYSTDFLFQKGIDFVEHATTEMHNDPFVLFLSITDPHSPNEVRPPYDKMYKHMKVSVPNTAIRKIKRDPAAPAFNHDNKNAKYDVYLEPDEIHAYIRNIDKKSKFPIENHVQTYFGMVKLLDDKLGEFIQRLKDMDVYNNSYIIFSSDHGDLLAEHGRIDKNSPYEASAKIPFIIKYPTNINGVKQIDSAYSQVDFAPTLLGLLGISYNSIEFQGADGTNEILNEKIQASTDHGTFVLNSDGSTERLQSTNTEHQDKVIFSYTSFRNGDDNKGWIAAMKDGYKYIVSNGEPVLFDLSLDPDELQNFITSPSHKIILRQLQQALKDYLLGDESNFSITAYLDPPSCSNTMDVFPIYSNGDKNFISCDDLDGMNDSRCNREKVRANCPTACDVNCADSTGEVYHKRTILKCGDLSSYCDDDKIRSFCPKTCQATGEVDGNLIHESKPTDIHTEKPSFIPTETRTELPSGKPSAIPSQKPSVQPSKTATLEPSSIPSVKDSNYPTRIRSENPSAEKTFNPSSAMTSLPSMAPSSNKPSMLPSKLATGEPSSSPSVENSNLPSSKPTTVKSSNPSMLPTNYPSLEKSTGQTHLPSVIQSNKPSFKPSGLKSSKPSEMLSNKPSSLPSNEPSDLKSSVPTGNPTALSSSLPSNKASFLPSIKPSPLPSMIRSSKPSLLPSSMPTVRKSEKPSLLPSSIPTVRKSEEPSLLPSSIPTVRKSEEPTVNSSFYPSSVSTEHPFHLPSMQPTTAMSTEPSLMPTLKSSQEPSQKGSNSPSQLATTTPSNEKSSPPSEPKTTSNPDVIDITSVHRVCKDDSKFRFWNKEINKRVNCGFIMYHRPIDAKIQREKFCLPNSKIFQRCKWSCGICDNSIHDDPTFSFRQGKHDKFAKCKFITANSKERKNRQKNLCQKSHDGVDVKDACALSCGNFG